MKEQKTDPFFFPALIFSFSEPFFSYAENTPGNLYLKDDEIMRSIAIPPGMETELFVMERGAVHAIPEVLKSVFPGKRPWIIADQNTWAVAGKKIQALLDAAEMNPFEPRIFPGTPILHPDNRYCEELAAAMPENAVPVAVGSGVVNDLVKRGSAVAGVRYCCVPTACSVDGYTSYGAALSVDGFKKTLPCPAPQVLVADLDVLATAPAEMFAAGYADLLAKIPGGADWRVAETLGIEPVDETVWNLVQKNLRSWLSDPSDMDSVFMGLAATGYSMQMYRDSRPASGAEHLLSHIWEMEGLQFKGKDVSHGFKVGVGTVASVRLMEFLTGTDVNTAKRMAAPPSDRETREREMDDLLKRNCYGQGVRDVTRAKFLEGDALLERREKIWTVWPDLQRKLAEQNVSSAKIVSMLKQVHAPSSPEEIGLGREQYLHAVRAAQLIRKRYTILDLLYEAGLLEAALAKL